MVTRSTLAERSIAQRFPVLTWAAVATMIAIAILMLHRAPTAEIRQARVDPDHELLIEIERAVQSDGPEALEPAALLAQEMIQARPSHECAKSTKRRLVMRIKSVATAVALLFPLCLHAQGPQTTQGPSPDVRAGKVARIPWGTG